jgi:UDPglucose 6-dehydrogenase
MKNDCRLERPNTDNIPIYEPGLGEIVAAARGRNLFFLQLWIKLLMKHKLYISVNTPTKAYGKGKGMAADLKYIELCTSNCTRSQRQ